MDKARARELLANEHARLERLLRAEIAATAPDLGDEVDDANWRIAEETGRAVSRSLRDRWSALQRAEERLERGTYGRSVLSGKPIPDERLEADPLAALTVEEAAAEAFRARHSADSVSGLTSTRRTLAALVDRDEVTEEPDGAAPVAPAGSEDVDEEEAEEEVAAVADLDVEEVEEVEELEVEELEVIAEEEAPADFDEGGDEAEEEAAADEEQERSEGDEEERPPRRRSGRR